MPEAEAKERWRMVREVGQHHFKEEPPEEAERQPGEERATGSGRTASLKCPKDESEDASKHDEQQEADPMAERWVSKGDAEPA